MNRNCKHCNQPIHPERLEALPTTNHCTNCTDQHGPKKEFDPNVICAKSSTSSQNGFAPND